MVRAFAIFHYFSNFNLTLQTYTISQLDCIPNSSRACYQGQQQQQKKEKKRVGRSLPPLQAIIMKIKSLFTLQVITKENKIGELEACCELLAPNIQATI